MSNGHGTRYTDGTPPCNEFPRRILSPTRSGPCCFSVMEELGRVRRGPRYEYVYRRCRTCGFTVRVIVRYLPDQARLAALRKLLDTTLVKNMLPA